MSAVNVMTTTELTRHNGDAKNETHTQDGARRSGSVQGVQCRLWYKLSCLYQRRHTSLCVDLGRVVGRQGYGKVSNIYADS